MLRVLWLQQDLSSFLTENWVGEIKPFRFDRTAKEMSPRNNYKENSKESEDYFYFLPLNSMIFNHQSPDRLGFSQIRAERTGSIWMLSALLERWVRYQGEEEKFSGIFHLPYGIIRSTTILLFPWLHKGIKKVLSAAISRTLYYLDCLRRGNRRKSRSSSQGQ